MPDLPQFNDNSIIKRFDTAVFYYISSFSAEYVIEFPIRLDNRVELEIRPTICARDSSGNPFLRNEKKIVADSQT
jgi:hypothetical protein